MRVFLPLTIAFLVAVFLYAEYGAEPTCEVWSYRAREGEEDSRVYVCKVETLAGIGRVYHLYIDGLKIENPDAKGTQDALAPVISHIPITEAAFRRSVLEKVRDDAPLPPYEAGYESWKKSYREKQAGVFEIPIKACIEGIAQAGQETKKRVGYPPVAGG